MHLKLAYKSPDELKKELPNILELNKSVRHKIKRIFSCSYNVLGPAPEWVAAIEEALQELLAKEAVERPEELYNCLMDMGSTTFPTVRPMIQSCLKYLHGFEIAQNSAEPRNIVILSNKKVSSSTSRVLALDLQTATIITLVNSPDTTEILSTKVAHLHKCDVVKMKLKKVKNDMYANTYVIHYDSDTLILGRVNNILSLFDKCCRRVHNVFYDRSDYDAYVYPIGHGSKDSGDYYPVSSFDEVLHGVFEVGRKRIRHFLVNFTGTQILPHRRIPQQLQIKMHNHFINVSVSKKHCGMYYKGIALLSCPIREDGKYIYTAEELYGIPISETVLNKLFRILHRKDQPG